MSDASLLPLFKEQLENESREIGEKFNLKKRGDLLFWWYFLRIKDFAEDDIAAVYVDSPGDLAIDAIWIDDSDVVHFFQFRNPEDMAKGYKAGDVDKILGGLRLILLKKCDKLVPPETLARIEEIYDRVRNGYRLHLVSSGKVGVTGEGKVKLDAFAEEVFKGSPSLFQWIDENLERLHDTFYQKNLPAIQTPIEFQLSDSPHMVTSGRADCYMFHLKGCVLADLYEQYGEPLLQRNIRVDQGATPTNRSIEDSCTGPESANFLHYNNGITFICDRADFHPFQKVETLQKAQVVNGGQTIRALHRMSKKGSLKDDVLVPIRVITSNGDKDFASNVAVNQNNQNQLGSGFLRSNDPKVVQLEHSLASIGWYLERREDELSHATAEEKAAIAQRIGHQLQGRVITLKEGAQAYVATFFGQPELAKKNAKKMFLTQDDGGYFERIFSADLTAEKMAVAFRILSAVQGFVKQFMTRKRRQDRVADWKADYAELLGGHIIQEFLPYLDQAVPQCGVFVCGTLFKDYVEIQGRNPGDLADELEKDPTPLVRQHLAYVFDCFRGDKALAAKSWPSLLKSNAFFSQVVTFIRGIRKTKSSLF